MKKSKEKKEKRSQHVGDLEVNSNVKGWWENFMVAWIKKIWALSFIFLSLHIIKYTSKFFFSYFFSKVVHPCYFTSKQAHLSSFLFYFYFLLSGIEFLVYNVYGNRNSGKSKLQLYLLQYKILNWRSKPSSISKRYKILTLFVHFLLLFGNGFLLIEVVCLCCFDIFIGWDIFWSTPFL